MTPWLIYIIGTALGAWLILGHELKVERSRMIQQENHGHTYITEDEIDRADREWDELDDLEDE